MTDSKPRKPLRITLVCRASGSDKLTTAEGVSSNSFKCPICGQTLLYLVAENRITSHGEQSPGNDPKAPSPKHELRKVVIVNTEDVSNR